MNRWLRLAYRLYRLQWRITQPLFVGVRLILIQDGQVLLVRHTYQHHWYFPGGAVKRGETPVNAAKREAYEEAGVTLHDESVFLGAYTSFYEGKSDHIFVFSNTKFAVGKRLDRWEIAACEFFPLDALPPNISSACARRLAEHQQGNPPYIGAW